MVGGRESQPGERAFNEGLCGLWGGGPRMGVVKGQLEHAGQSHAAQQRREWVLQRVMWVGVGLVLAAALAGLLGRGPASRGTLSQDGITLEYERVVRCKATAELRMTLPSAGGEDGLVALEVGGGYLDHVELESVVPEPLEQRSRPGAVVLLFRPARQGEPLAVVLRAKVETIGRLRGSISTGAGAVRFEQIALP